jgi:hypothetical protein
LEGVGVTEGGLLLGTELLGDRIGFTDASDSSLRVRNDLATLDIETANFSESSVGGVALGEELGNNSERLAGIHSRTLAKEILDTHAVRVEVATILVAHTSIPVSIVIAALGTTATSLTRDGARVGSVGRALAVGLPDIHLNAASTILAGTGVGVVGRRLPVEEVCLAVDELHVVGTLSIAITGTILGASLVGGVLGHTTIGIHLHKVKGTVKTAGEVGEIHVEGELLALEVEHLVGGVVREEVHARTDVGIVLALGNELDVEAVARSLDAVSA